MAVVLNNAPCLPQTPPRGMSWMEGRLLLEMFCAVCTTPCLAVTGTVPIPHCDAARQQALDGTSVGEDARLHAKLPQEI